MPVPTIADTLKFANLQMAAEALYGFNATLPGVVLTPSAPLRDQPITPENLTTGNLHASKFTATEAAKFADQWTIVEHISNTSTGFSGTLFKNNATDELVLPFRSTEFIDDNLYDSAATNDGIFSPAGWAFGQIADMEAWYQELRTAGGPLARQSVDVTGYSLGGHLSTAFGILRGEAGDQGVIKHIYTYNGAGIGDDVVTGDAGADKLYGEEGNDWRQRVTHKSRRWRDGDSCSGSANQDTWRTAA